MCFTLSNDNQTVPVGVGLDEGHNAAPTVNDEAQTLHVDAPNCMAYVPTGQAEQAEAAELEKVPGGQG